MLISAVAQEQALLTLIRLRLWFYPFEGTLAAGFMTERLLRDSLCCPRRFSFKSRVWLRPNFGASSRCICHTVHGEDILFSSFLFSRRFPRVCRLQRRESEAVGGAAVVPLWMRRASCGPVPPFS